MGKFKFGRIDDPPGPRKYVQVKSEVVPPTEDRDGSWSFTLIVHPMVIVFLVAIAIVILILIVTAH